jgi:hypothetical protein
VGECCRGRLEGFRACSCKRTLARQASAGGNDRKYCVAGVFAVRGQFSTWCVRAGPHGAYWFMPTAELCPTAMERRAVSAYLRAIERASLRHHRGEGEAQACSRPRPSFSVSFSRLSRKRHSVTFRRSRAHRPSLAPRRALRCAGRKRHRAPSDQACGARSSYSLTRTASSFSHLKMRRMRLLTKVVPVVGTKFPRR